MSTIKHIVTLKCSTNCEKCVNKLSLYQPKGVLGTYGRRQLYAELSCVYDHIIITGGEPTLAPNLGDIIRDAANFFPKVSLFTRNPTIVSGKYPWGFRMGREKSLLDCLHSINFSSMQGHEELTELDAPEVLVNVPVYFWLPAEASLLPIPDQSRFLLLRGYSGLTYYEIIPDGVRLRSLIPTYANFSVQHRTQEDCVRGNVILPDGRHMSVRKWLGVI